MGRLRPLVYLMDGGRNGMADLVTDPVCGMQIRSEEAVATEEQRRPHLLLLSKACHDAFVSDPHRYGHPEE